MKTETRVTTESGRLYLKKLCRHFAHKVPTSLHDSEGLIDFPFGRCRLAADDESLMMTIAVVEKAECDSAERVLSEHLQRMAPNETLKVEWLRDAR